MLILSSSLIFRLKNMLQSREELDKLIEKINNGELSEQDELVFLKELNFSYDVLNKFLEELKVAKLSADLIK